MILPIFSESCRTAGFVIVLAVFQLAACGGGGERGDVDMGDASGECPSYPAAYAFAQQIHHQVQERLYFGSQWEMTVWNTVYRPPRLWQRPPLLVSGPMDDILEGALTYSGETRYRFAIPEAVPPVSCAEIEAYVDEEGITNTNALKALILFDYMMRLQAAISPGNGIPVQGTGFHSSREAPSFSTERVVEYGFLCSFDNPCAQDRKESFGCDSGPVPHTVNARFFIELDVDETMSAEDVRLTVNDANLYFDIESVSPSGNTQVQVTRTGNYDFEFIPGSIDVCDNVRPLCLGTETGSEACGLGFQAHDDRLDGNEPDIRLEDGEYLDYRVVSDTGEIRTKRVALRCLRGCECVRDADCDDGRPCTRDSCNRGLCESVADDSIRPEQVPDDCRYCENGELISVREQVERECEQARADTVSVCSSGSNWLVHWVQEFGSAPAQQAHFCSSGVVPGDSELTICDGRGECPAGSPSTFRNETVDRLCSGFAGQSVQFACDVFCTRCE